MTRCYLHSDGVSVIILGNWFFENSAQYTQQLEDHKLTLDLDYSWSYYPPIAWTHENIDQDRPSEAFTKITFADPALATFYAMKWT